MDYIKNFAPSWFASIMGTGILAISCKLFSEYFSVLLPVSIFLFWFNLFIFFLFLVLWILRWLLFYEKAKDDLFHPIISSFYPTIAVAFLVIAGGYIIILHNTQLAEIFWFLGTLLMIAFAFLIPFIMFSHEKIEISHINPGWYIPPVGLIVIPIAGAFFEPLSTGVYKELITITNFLGYGAGFFLYIALLAIIVYRLILHSPLPGTIAPTLWINLGPIGAGNIALINIISKTSFISVKEPFYIFSLIFWGFGLWWLVMSIIMTIRYIKRAELNYTMSWWAFIFPLGAYTASTYLIGKILHLKIISILGFFIFWLLFFIWCITFFKTFTNIKKIFKG
ncbi:C4-Dicarboxylate transporter [Nautilia profundicola AmH]|uniref:C4-Dicarboxylate transporter n=1 Tax=Nautilia profundicola (strain ATCC BAA-1463 / DSM 18972 / AmH) TaxID=598659 RepID=B9L858_NAUPA|nr:tellurite-resistance/dicarboxylate transporter [Nautilia profundicola]ACM93790.1 C4-Dicarboxylate transporter [Nautilia profundicola AmH]